MKGDWKIICGTVYLYLVLLLEGSLQLGCEPGIQCAGFRPKSSSGCCPLLPGDECDTSHQITCDTDLGYKCSRGICRGEYNVTSEWTGVTSINLTWSPFLPDDTPNTYTVLYSTQLHQDPLMLNSHFSLFTTTLSQKIRHIRWNSKRKSMAPCASSGAAGAEKSPKRFRIQSLTDSDPATETEDYETHVKELAAEVTRNEVITSHTRTLLKSTFRQRRNWITSVPAGNVATILEKFTCFKLKTFIMAELMMMLRLTSLPPVLKRFELVFEAASCLMKKKKDVDSLEILQYIENETSYKHGKGQRTKPVVQIVVAWNQTSFLLQGLTPSTWYYVQVGIWTGSVYENLSEIVLTQTKAMDHCLYNGRRLSIGEQLVVDCEESCYCAPTGRFQCVPVCSKLHPDTPVCSDMVTHKECCDHVHRCFHDSCSYLGEPVQHEYSWVIDCAENCTCYDGSVTCIPLCGIVTIPDNCTHPVLTKSFEGCCDSLKCQAREDTCQYKNTSYIVDTWFHGSDCKICTCTSSREVTCVDLHICGATTTLPDTSVACPVPTVTDNSCCEQIICDRQTDTDDIFSTYSITKYSVSSILVRFQFISTKDEQDAMQMTLFYSNDVTTGDITTWMSNVSVAFNNVIDTTNATLELRDFGKPFVLYKINNNYLFVIPKLTLNTFYFIKLQIEFDKNKKVIPEYIAETRVIKLPALQLDAPYHLTSRVGVSLTVASISSSSAFISWTLPEPLLHNISSFLIKYKPFSASQWQFTERLIFSDRNFLLQCLFHSKWYEAHLEAHPGGRRLATTFFNTSSIKEFSTEKFFPSIRNISIRTLSVALTWQGIPMGVATDVFNIEILWTCGTDGDTLLKACVTAEQDSYILQDLASGTMYTVWLGYNMKDGTTVFANRLHFVTLHQYNTVHSGTRRSIIVAITVACLSFVAMVIAVAIVIYLLKFKRRASYNEHTSFENRIFQIYSNKEDRDL